MNEVVRATDKSLKLIDVLSHEMAKEARRLSNALHPWSTSSLDTLAKNVAAAEAMVATPEYQALVGVLEAAFAHASITDIKRELGLLFACFPAKDVDIGVLVAFAVEEVIRERPSTLQLLLSVRRIRRTCKFRPSIADIVEALNDVEPGMSRARRTIELAKHLDLAASALRDIVGSVTKHVEMLLSDRERRLEGAKSVESIDEKLKEARRTLASVSAHRLKVLEPQRLLITLSIGVTNDRCGRHGGG